MAARLETSKKFLLSGESHGRIRDARAFRTLFRSSRSVLYLSAVFNRKEMTDSVPFRWESVRADAPRV